MDKRKKSKIEKYINELPDNYRVRLGPWKLFASTNKAIRPEHCSSWTDTDRSSDSYLRRCAAMMPKIAHAMLGHGIWTTYIHITSACLHIIWKTIASLFGRLRGENDPIIIHPSRPFLLRQLSLYIPSSDAKGRLVESKSILLWRSRSDYPFITASVCTSVLATRSSVRLIFPSFDNKTVIYSDDLYSSIGSRLILHSQRYVLSIIL